MTGAGIPAFNSGAIAPGASPFAVTFGAEGVFPYHCEFHPTMQGRVTVAMGGPSDAFVTIQPAMTSIRRTSRSGLAAPCTGATARSSPTPSPRTAAAFRRIASTAARSSATRPRSRAGRTANSLVRVRPRPRDEVAQLPPARATVDVCRRNDRHPCTEPGRVVRGRDVAPPPLLLPPDIAERQDPRTARAAPRRITCARTSRSTATWRCT